MSAFLATPQAIRRRRAFYAALEPLVGDQRALASIALWENTLGSEQPLLRGLAPFATLAVSELNLPVKAGDLTLRLLECLQRPDSLLPADPLPRLLALVAAAEAAGVSSPATAPAASAAAAPTRPRDAPAAARAVDPAVAQRRSLGVLLLRLCDHAGQADPRNQGILVNSFVSAAEAEFADGVAADVANLLSGRSAELTHDYGRGRAAQVVNTFYVLLADLFGPVSADRIVTQAVRSAENSPEARQFAPRDLL